MVPPPRKLKISASSCISAALTGSAPGSLPRFSRPVASCPTCHSLRRIGLYYTRSCISCIWYLRWQSSALRRSWILGYLGPVAPIPRTACSRPTAQTTSRDFRQDFGSLPARTSWKGVWQCTSPGDARIPDCDQILQQEFCFWLPPQFSFPFTLEVYPLFELSRLFRMVAVEVCRGEDFCHQLDDELSWIGRDDKRGSRCHNCVDGGWL